MSLKSVQSTWVVGLLLALAVTGCGLLQKEADPQDAMVMENSETVEPDAKVELPAAYPKTPPTVVPAATAIEDSAPEPPAPQAAKPSTQDTKNLKTKPQAPDATKTVNFKLPQKSKASIDLSQKGQDLVLQFKGSQIKKGKYWVFLVKSCKERGAGNISKLAIFNVKNGKNFSDDAKTRAATLRSDSKKGLKGKALVLYFGPKAQDRLACSSVK